MVRGDFEGTVADGDVFVAVAVVVLHFRAVPAAGLIAPVIAVKRGAVKFILPDKFVYL